MVAWFWVWTSAVTALAEHLRGLPPRLRGVLSTQAGGATPASTRQGTRRLRHSDDRISRRGTATTGYLSPGPTHKNPSYAHQRLEAAGQCRSESAIGVSVS